MTSLHHIAQALDSTAVRKMPTEPTGAAKIFQFHRKTNILHSVFTLKSRIQVNLRLFHKTVILLGYKPISFNKLFCQQVAAEKINPW
ncbi:MAG: hypothetical protein OFPII_19680 [Osedax symbiont Rs1]|nr:MAG: hypothetical protein OFPII_19680 [Osedax symbiont Rs1]